MQSRSHASSTSSRHGLEPARAGDRAEDAADRALLLAQVLELTSELGVVGGHAGHLPSLETGGARCHRVGR